MFTAETLSLTRLLKNANERLLTRAALNSPGDCGHLQSRDRKGAFCNGVRGEKPGMPQYCVSGISRRLGGSAVKELFS
jgi:hypothetical protein